MEAAISNKVGAPGPEGGSGVRSAVHPAIHPSRDHSIRVDGPLFDREGRVLRPAIEVDVHETERERSMRMHPAGKAAIYRKSAKTSVDSSNGEGGGRGSRDHSRVRDEAKAPLSEIRHNEHDETPGGAIVPGTIVKGGRDEARGNGPRRAGRSDVGRPNPCGAHRVQAGDTLWSIAAEALETQNLRRIARYWPRIHRHNVDVIGSNPDLIYPGQVLELPAECDD